MKQKIISGLCAIALLASGPLALAQSVVLDKAATQEAIEDALNQSEQGAATIPSIKKEQVNLEATVKTKASTMAEISREKRQVRLQIAEQKKLAEEFKLRYGLEPTDTDELFEMHRAQQLELQEFVKSYARMLALHENQLQNTVQASLLQIISNSPLVSFSDIAQRKILLASQERLVELSKASVNIPTTMAALGKDHTELLEAYHTAAADQKNAQYKINLNQAQLIEIKRIMSQVEERVRVMQLEMARIDDKLRMQAEQELIAKGLRTTQKTIVSRRPDFIWPVIGRITATFYDKGYQAFFGVPHKAIDIAAPQATALKASSDGIVYFVKNGGQTGYSYILIGHRDGYATLYGHVLQSYVAKGDHIRQGEIIGLSGGRPGTVGAGPMTTGPHLHFETIKDGVHVDPMTILPPQ